MRVKVENSSCELYIKTKINLKLKSQCYLSTLVQLHIWFVDSCVILLQITNYFPEEKGTEVNYLELMFGLLNQILSWVWPLAGGLSGGLPL